MAVGVAGAAEAREAVVDWLRGGPATGAQLRRAVGASAMDAAALLAGMEQDGVIIADRSDVPTRWMLVEAKEAGR